jgi:alpha-tubulin suppressor-like RCC1 family protein
VQSPSADWQWIAIDQLFGAVCGIRGSNTNGGDLWCWGYNGTFQLGTGSSASPQDPVEVGTQRDWSRIDLGLDFACGISAVGELRCWGNNDSKQVSNADVFSVSAIPQNEILPGTHFLEVAAGWNHVCALTTLNEVMCWGDGGSGQLGDGNKAHLTPYPVMAPP